MQDLSLWCLGFLVVGHGFSSCGAWTLLVGHGLSSYGAWTPYLWYIGSVVVA